MSTTLQHIAWTVFGILGGGSVLLHLGLKYAPDALQAAAQGLLKRYPAARHWIAEHAQDLVTAAQALEKSEEDIIAQAQKDDTQPPGKA